MDYAYNTVKYKTVPTNRKKVHILFRVPTEIQKRHLPPVPWLCREIFAAKNTLMVTFVDWDSV